MEGANPCKKDAGGLRELIKTLQKIIPWHQKSKSSRKLPPDHGAIAEDCKDVSADKTSVVSAAKTSVVSADKTSVVSQNMPMALRRRPQRGRVGNGVGMSWDIDDFLSADAAGVLPADTTDVSSAGAAENLSRDTAGLCVQATAEE